ncbi:MAG: hypothetical protein AAGJ54_03625 [Planctomycetota bacterium]
MSGITTRRIADFAVGDVTGEVDRLPGSGPNRYLVRFAPAGLDLEFAYEYQIDELVDLIHAVYEAMGFIESDCGRDPLLEGHPI